MLRNFDVDLEALREHITSTSGTIENYSKEKLLQFLGDYLLLPDMEIVIAQLESKQFWSR